MDIPDSDAVYYRMREKQEHDLADVATVEEARAIHQALADKYRSLAAEAKRREQCSIASVAPRSSLASPFI